MGQKPCLKSSASGPAISVSSYSIESSELSLGKAKPPLTLRFPFDVPLGEVHIALVRTHVAVGIQGVFEFLRTPIHATRLQIQEIPCVEVECCGATKRHQPEEP